MAEIHHFTYGWSTVVAAILLAFLGSLLGLVSAARARQARTRRHQGRWLFIAAVAIGGGIWLMHFTAMLGFDVPSGTTRYDPLLTMASLALAVAPVWVGLLLVGRDRPSTSRILGSGLFTGFGVLAMHYTGMSALQVVGAVVYDPVLVAASAAVAVVAATTALWFATAVRGRLVTPLAAAVMGAAVCGMHYTGMAAVRVHPAHTPVKIDGISPFLLVVPITVLTAAVLIATACTALQAITEEEFGGGTTGRHRETVPHRDTGAAPAAPGQFLPPHPGQFLPPHPGQFLPPHPGQFLPPARLDRPATMAGHPQPGVPLSPVETPFVPVRVSVSGPPTAPAA